ncbi:MAG TPA: gamma-glutamyl-gamma-aminobutyrate hydrolase family protein [Terriglobia bacterium]|nr:gamma-glutamyl-gamma-aminobutyrate hydrolase family protein [Terriglobia bacterium]
MAKPWIGIPTRYHEKTEYIGQIRHYLDAVFWAGGLPLLIPSSGDCGVVREYVARVHGILLPGSPTDIDPAHYGASRHGQLGRLHPERDSTDFTILEEAERRALPVLGICFGVQSLNVHRGGTLVQDIASLVPGPVTHDEEDERPPARHVVHLDEDSLIAGLAGRSELEVNSYHHQAVETPGRNLRAVAFAPDGVIEAVEDTTGRFVIGVQWHPERGWKDDPFSKALFASLIEEAQLRYNDCGSP